MVHVTDFVKDPHRQLRKPVQIEIKAHTPDNTETWRVAILSCDPKSEANVISEQLVTQVLRTPVCPLDEKAAAALEQRGRHLDRVNGYVDLVWCFGNNTIRMQSTRFLVTSSHDPPYDAVLGRPDAEQHGLLKARRKR